MLLYIIALSITSSHSFHYNFQSNVVVAMYRSNTNPQGRNNVVGCPLVRPLRNFDLRSILGGWNVIQYYASSEEATEYSCMRCVFDIVGGEQIVMNFTYQFADDPANELLQGNITWKVPDIAMPSHWVHAEDPCMILLLIDVLGNFTSQTVNNGYNQSNRRRRIQHVHSGHGRRRMGADHALCRENENSTLSVRAVAVA